MTQDPPHEQDCSCNTCIERPFRERIAQLEGEAKMSLRIEGNNLYDGDKLLFQYDTPDAANTTTIILNLRDRIAQLEAALERQEHCEQAIIESRREWIKRAERAASALRETRKALKDLVKLYVCNPGTEYEFIACITPDRRPKDGKKSKCWDAWDAAREAIAKGMK